MDASTHIESHMKRIEDLVLDEENIVTYKFLSRDLGIHVNTAKQLLYVFLTQQRQGRADCRVAATYLLAGRTLDGKHLVSIVAESDLDDAYQRYDELTSEHVYSVQKGDGAALRNNPDALYAVDMKLDPFAGAPIKLGRVIRRPTPEKSAVVKQDQDVTDKKSSVLKNEKISDKKDIGHFFNNQRKKMKTDEPVKESRTVEEFPPAEGRKKEETIRIVEKENYVEKNSNRDTAGRKKDTEMQDKSRDKKKRKRILYDSSESETDEETKDAALSIDVETPEVETRKISDEEKQDDNMFQVNKKRKKVINKTVLREDGYLETTKKIVYETDSDTEMPQKDCCQQPKTEASGGASRSALRSEPPARKNEKVKLGKGPLKQSSLLSFFQKK